MDNRKILGILEIIKESGKALIILGVALCVLYGFSIETKLPNLITSGISNSSKSIGEGVDAHAKHLEDLINTHASNIEKLVDKHAEKIENKADGQLTNLQTNTKFVLDSAINQTEGNIGNAINKADGQLTLANNSISGVVTDANKLTNAATVEFPAFVNKKYGNFIDCDLNDRCIPKLFVDTLISTRESSKDISLTMNTFNNKVFPQLSDNFMKITTNSQQITDNINKLTKPHFYDRLLGWGLNSAVLYRELNPATNAVSVIVQAVSSQK